MRSLVRLRRTRDDTMACFSLRSSYLLPLFLDLLLQFYEPVEHIFRPRRTSRNIDIHGDDCVDALHRRIVVIKSTRAGAYPKSDDPLRLTHLVVYSFKHWPHLVADSAHHK